ncbi:MAG TPA: glycosyltransferase family 2 protein [Rubrivivax sp.]|nr:glycosyltransferase family 2 protein [Rubrivivax sp.]
MNAPTVTVLVSSYNYRDYVVPAVQSALSQTAPPLQVVVVDDGSTDDSWNVLQQAFGADPRVTLRLQPNGGQMAAWVNGLAHARGDIVALLDSDDEWKPDYLQRVRRVYQADPSVDYVYCNMEKFGAASGLALTKRRHRRSRDLGLSMLLGAFVQRWQGVATSGNTLRRELLARILTLPPEQAAQWRTRPDDCLFYGSDILGGHKVYLAEPLVRHREHANNALLEFRGAPIKQARYAYRVERMLDHYRQAAGCSPYWLKMARREFQTKPDPSFSEWWMYTGFALRAPIRLSARCSQAASILLHYLRSLGQRHEVPGP